MTCHDRGGLKTFFLLTSLNPRLNTTSNIILSHSQISQISHILVHAASKIGGNLAHDCTLYGLSSGVKYVLKQRVDMKNYHWDDLDWDYAARDFLTPETPWIPCFVRLC